jgi:hypothetical protein
MAWPDMAPQLPLRGARRWNRFDGPKDCGRCNLPLTVAQMATTIEAGKSWVRELQEPMPQPGEQCRSVRSRCSTATEAVA